ncbi:hypothetical protein ES703_76677 [subsurface metagenome]
MQNLGTYFAQHFRIIQDTDKLITVLAGHYGYILQMVQPHLLYYLFKRLIGRGLVLYRLSNITGEQPAGHILIRKHLLDVSDSDYPYNSRLTVNNGIIHTLRSAEYLKNLLQRHILRNGCWAGIHNIGHCICLYEVLLGNIHSYFARLFDTHLNQYRADQFYDKCLGHNNRNDDCTEVHVKHLPRYDCQAYCKTGLRQKTHSQIFLNRSRHPAMPRAPPSAHHFSSHPERHIRRCNCRRRRRQPTKLNVRTGQHKKGDVGRRRELLDQVKNTLALARCQIGHSDAEDHRRENRVDTRNHCYPDNKKKTGYRDLKNHVLRPDKLQKVEQHHTCEKSQHYDSKDLAQKDCRCAKNSGVTDAYQRLSARSRTAIEQQCQSIIE